MGGATGDEPMNDQAEYLEAKRKPGETYRIVDALDPHEMNTGPFYWRRREEEGLKFAFVAEQKHCNSGGIVHGGLLMTFADMVMCVAGQEGTTDQGVFTISFNSEFIASAKVGETVKARTEVTRRTGRMAFVRADIYTENDLVMTCSAVLRRIPAPMD